ncbi:MAG: hypothetical protein R3B74_05420 [Nitrospirales bacterium]|nr:hypothetical protein [Nitrospirales bacterium]
MTFRNNLAAYLWGFSVIFLLFVSAMTYVLIRDGAPSGFPPIIIAATMAIFWMGAVGFALFAVSKHCLCVAIHPDSRVSIIWRFPFKKEEKSVSCAEMSPATVFESIDNEGASYFYVHVPLYDGTTIKIAEGHDRASCEATCARFNAMLWSDSTEDIG